MAWVSNSLTELCWDASYIHILGLHGWMTRELNPGGAVFSAWVCFPAFRQPILVTTMHCNSAPARGWRNMCSSSCLIRYPKLSVSLTISSSRGAAGQQQYLCDKGPTLRDARHRFVLSGIVELPLGLQTSNIISLQSANRFNITRNGRQWRWSSKGSASWSWAATLAAPQLPISGIRG